MKTDKHLLEREVILSENVKLTEIVRSRGESLSEFVKILTTFALRKLKKLAI